VRGVRLYGRLLHLATGLRVIAERRLAG
jgi:hypothetical protein